MASQKQIKEQMYETTIQVFVADYKVVKGREISAELMKCILDKMHRVETTLNRLNLKYYTKRLSDEESQQWIKAKNEARRLVEIELGFKIFIDDDPAMSSICVHLPSGRTNNNMEGQSWRILW